MTKEKVLLIGGGGFMGHNLAIHLQKKYNCDVLIADNFQINNYLSILSNSDNTPNPKLSKYILDNRFDIIEKNNIKLKIVDARDYHLLTQTIKEFAPNYVVQLAAVSHANRSNKTPHSTFDHSFRTLENALDITRKNIKKFIYISSSMVYGNFKKETVDEEEFCEPLGIYGALKLSGEIIVKSYHQVFGLPYVIVRPSALYGERCISRRVSQIFIENALTNKEILIDGDGTEKLDFTYIKDLIEGISLCLFKKSADNQTFNLTYGKSEEINALVEILKKNFTNLNINYKVRDKLVPLRGTLSVEKAKRLLGYNPSWPIEKGYQEYIDWYKSIFENYLIK